MIKQITVTLLAISCILYLGQYKARASSPILFNNAEGNSIVRAEMNPAREELKGSIEEWLHVHCPPEKYGRKALLKKGRIQFAIQEKDAPPTVRAVIVLPQKRPVGIDGFYLDGIDCFEGAYALKKALQAKGYTAHICRGQTDLWENHFYVEVEFGGEWMRINTAPGMPHFDFVVKKYDVLPEEKTELSFKLSGKTLSVGPALTPMASIYLPQSGEIIITASMAVQAPDKCVILCQASLVEGGQTRNIGGATLSVSIGDLPKLQKRISRAGGRGRIPGFNISINNGEDRAMKAAKSAIYEIIYDIISKIDTHSLSNRISQGVFNV